MAERKQAKQAVVLEVNALFKKAIFFQNLPRSVVTMIVELVSLHSIGRILGSSLEKAVSLLC